MTRVEWRGRVVIDANVHHGDPCIKGTRIPVSIVVGSLADGMTVPDVVEAYPQLTAEDVSAALAYAAEGIKQQEGGDPCAQEYKS